MNKEENNHCNQLCKNQDPVCEDQKQAQTSEDQLLKLTKNGNPKAVLHVLGIPHTIIDSEIYSPCAFSMKILRFSRMMQKYGWTVYEYSNEGTKSGCDKHIQILSKDELRILSQVKENEMYDKDVQNFGLIYTYNNRMYEKLKEHTKSGDIVCHVFGADPAAASAVPLCYHVESGIGYTGGSYVLPYRIFESSAWMHWHEGTHGKSWGMNYHYVAPNYYDTSEWEINLNPVKKRVLFFGRFVESKGLSVLVEIAKLMPDYDFIICGQGSPDEWLKSDNIRYHKPVFGLARSKFVGEASCLLMPTYFIEPFGGSAVEAQFCGVPVVSTPYGAFLETIEDGVTGFHCNTLADFVDGIEKCQNLNRSIVAERARRLFSLETVGKKYDKILSDISDQKYGGWYSKKSNR
jgi:glycosyltransferase involved in cell wall biosynthesis